MSALGRHLAEGNLDGQRITGLVQRDWTAASGDERGPFHAVLLSCPGRKQPHYCPPTVRFTPPRPR